VIFSDEPAGPDLGIVDALGSEIIEHLGKWAIFV
jgi:hypothetical protein